jgi:hypothetical protein
MLDMASEIFVAFSALGSIQNSSVGGASEYDKGLAELAKNVGGLTPAVATFTITTILFFDAVRGRARQAGSGTPWAQHDLHNP